MKSQQEAQDLSLATDTTAKKPRKQRSDKGVKRGPRKPKQ